MEARAHLRHLLRLDGRDGFPLELYKGRKCLPHERHLWRLEEREYPPLETCKSENISLDQCKRRSNPPRNRPMAVGLGKARRVSKRTYFWKPRCGATRTQTRSDSRICTILRRIYPKAGLKAKLNSTIMAMFILHPPSQQFKVFRSLRYCRLSKTLKGVLLTLKKDKILIGPNNV